MTTRRIGYHWHLRRIMAAHNMWKTTDLAHLLRDRGISLSAAQVYRLVTDKPERLPLRTLSALCDIFDCTPAELVEPFVEATGKKAASATVITTRTRPADGVAGGFRPRPARIVRYRRRTCEQLMARPRKPPNPNWYLPCARCQLEYMPVARWPDGGICGYCYQQAKRTRGTCFTCGHIGVLPGRTPVGENTCRTCSGTLNVDCVACGAEAELYSAGLCWSCTLARHVDWVLAGDGGKINPALLPLADPLKQMTRANSGLTWIRQQPVHDLLTRLANRDIPLEHAAFDQLEKSNTLNHIRQLLVEHGVLPQRDRHLATFEIWLGDKLATIDDAEQRKIIERFGRWHHLRRLRTASATKPITLRAQMNAKQTTTVAINFLTWLSAQSIELGQLSQAEIDSWHANGPSTNGRVDAFLFWAKSHRLIGKLEVPRHHRGNGPILGRHARIDAIRRVLLDDEMLLHNRVAAGLVLLYGQPVHRVADTRVERVTIREDGVTIKFARDDLDVPEPFATLLATLCRSRANLQTAAHRDSPWLFPGYVPGAHINALHLAEALRQHNAPPLAGRACAWQPQVLISRRRTTESTPGSTLD